jgi:class 3 adenylate cyclase/rhodanese-related sulfurtransferase
MSPQDLKRQLDRGQRPLLLDARRAEAFKRNPSGIAAAVPVLLDEEPARIPDLPRDTPVAVYCLCSGQASSTRVALWLERAGYTDICVLEGGLPAWQDSGLPLAELKLDRRGAVAWMPAPVTAAAAYGSLLAEQAFLAGVALPARRDMAVLFVDMVDSTRLLFSRPPEEVLRLVQTFMQVVVDIAVQHCGDVHDFEGDGAMLYFAGPGEAVPAAFNLRKALAARRHCEPDLPQARFGLDAGPLVVGYIGSRERRSLSFIGPSVNAAARILKLAPPEGIVATGHIVAQAQRTDPDLAARFVALPEKQSLKGWPEPVTVLLAT